MTQLNAQALMAMPYAQMVACVKSWNRRKMDETHQWRFWQRDDQSEPQGDWRTWLVMAGRGYGKTRMGAEWVSARATQYPGARFALVGATLNEARQVMVEGESGLLALPFAERPLWEPSLRRLTWRNNATATLFSAAEPESLRGPQHDFAWADEIAKWPNGIKAWDNLMLGLRLGRNPRAMATTTPRPVPLLRRLVLEQGVAMTRGRTADNDVNLPPEYLASVRAAYAGMATLVLTAVGSALGGPIGGAIGAALGQQIDGALFAPAPRQGSRLKELAVQTSSYGTQIPGVFGAMRVAGTVIWATDLIEERVKSGGGKGRPSTVNYSYRVSLAVALSSRPVARLGRIWADGNLICGAGDDLKTDAQLRFYSGYADQQPDPVGRRHA